MDWHKRRGKVLTYWVLSTFLVGTILILCDYTVPVAGIRPGGYEGEQSEPRRTLLPHLLDRSLGQLPVGGDDYQKHNNRRGLLNFADNTQMDALEDPSPPGLWPPDDDTPNSSRFILEVEDSLSNEIVTIAPVPLVEYNCQVDGISQDRLSRAYLRGILRAPSPLLPVACDGGFQIHGKLNSDPTARFHNAITAWSDLFPERTYSGDGPTYTDSDSSSAPQLDQVPLTDPIPTSSRAVDTSDSGLILGADKGREFQESVQGGPSQNSSDDNTSSTTHGGEIKNFRRDFEMPSQISVLWRHDNGHLGQHLNNFSKFLSQELQTLPSFFSRLFNARGTMKRTAVNSNLHDRDSTVSGDKFPALSTAKPGQIMVKSSSAQLLDKLQGALYQTITFPFSRKELPRFHDSHRLALPDIFSASSAFTALDS